MAYKVGMIIAHMGFRDEEYWVPKDVFISEGLAVDTISSDMSVAISKFGKTAEIDKLLIDTKADDYDALVFIGGPGTDEYFQNSVVHDLARELLNQNKILAAICIAPVILANAGLLKDKKVTVFPSGKKDIEYGGAVYIDQPVMEDGYIITANGPAAAQAFAELIVSRLH